MGEHTSEPVLIVGAGPAGLATAACLKRRKIPLRIFEAGDTPATTWRLLYDRLHLHTVRALSGLPGYPMSRRFPRYLARAQVVEYLDAYARHFGLVIETGMPVRQATPENNGWRVETPTGTHTGRALVSATGIFSNPMQARYPGEEMFHGQIAHSASYRNASPFVGQRVLVIGVGNSGAEIAVDLAEHGAHPTVSIRAGANVVPRELVGVPIQRWAHLIARLPPSVTQRVLAPVMLRQAVRRQTQAGVPRPVGGILDKPGIPVIGLELLQQARAGAIAIRPAVERFTEHGACFVDGREEPFDSVLVATGYRPSLDYLRGVLPLNAAGFPRVDGVRALDAPNLYFVGLNNNIRGTLFNIGHEAPLVADALSQ
ncbi:MAG TPA: NAD(P)/FAD-dependent oxidoreductase [Ktedonobacterales bacterium]|nr:NAD(P)/FAD-dependent oxidoreductase [Ktedonobacterales bacterium]